MVYYTFEKDGRGAYIQSHNELCDRKLDIPDDEYGRDVLSKDKGQLARVAMIARIEDGFRRCS